jgi:hypothetical protein
VAEAWPRRLAARRVLAVTLSRIEAMKSVPDDLNRVFAEMEQHRAEQANAPLHIRDAMWQLNESVDDLQVSVVKLNGTTERLIDSTERSSTKVIWLTVVLVALTVAIAALTVVAVMKM